MGDEKGAKLGQPVTQSLILSPTRAGPADPAAVSAASKPDDEPLIYLL